MKHLIQRYKINEIELETETFGDPAHPAILMVMGAAASRLYWPDALCTGLAAKGYCVTRYDHRDTGGSTTGSPGAPDYTLEDMAADITNLLNALGRPRAHLVGMSLGGYLSQVAALTHTEQIRSLTLIGSEPLGWDGDPLPHISPQFMAHFEAMAQLDWSDRSAVRALLLESDRLCAGSHYPFDAEKALRRIDADMDRSPSIASALNHGQITSTGTWDGAFRTITQPTLVIHGEQDPILPLANGQALADGIPNARLLVLDGVGHELPTPALPQIIAAISDFLSDCPA